MHLNHKKNLSNQAQADIYLQLSRMEDAGIPSLQAVDVLIKTAKGEPRNRFLKFKQYLQLGQTIVESGTKSGIFRLFDQDLLHMAEVSGNLFNSYQQLAVYYAQKARRIKKIKSQCYLPLVTLVLAIFIKPLPAFVLNEISLLEYSSASVGLLFKLGACVYVLVKLPIWLTKGGLKFLGLSHFLYKIQLRLPLLSPLLKAKYNHDFIHSLGMMLKAGMPMFDALPKAINTIKNPCWKEKYNPIILSVNQGNNLIHGLSSTDVIDGHVFQMILTGESSGKLNESLLHAAKIEQQDIELKEDMFSQWLPRIFYFTVILWLAVSITSTQSIHPVVL